MFTPIFAYSDGRYAHPLLMPLLAAVDEYHSSVGTYAAAPKAKKTPNCKHLSCPGPKGIRCMGKGGKCKGEATENTKAGVEKIKKAAKTKAAPTAETVKPKAEPKAKKPPAKEGPSDPASPSYVNQREINERKKDAEKLYGRDRVAQAEESLRKSLDKADIHVRISSNQTLESIISDRFKSQFETGKSSAAFQPEQRANTEAGLFGYKKDLPDEDRPIYGYMSRKSTASKTDPNKGEGAGADGYGDLVITLKPSVKDRATITGNDSLDRPPPTMYQPSPVKSASIASLLTVREVQGVPTPGTKERLDSIGSAKNLIDINKAGAFGRQSLYVEAQIHGKVTPSDIAEITYTNGKQPSQKVVDWAKNNGVNIKLVK